MRKRECDRTNGPPASRAGFYPKPLLQPGLGHALGVGPRGEPQCGAEFQCREMRAEVVFCVSGSVNRQMLAVGLRSRWKGRCDSHRHVAARTALWHGLPTGLPTTVSDPAQSFGVWLATIARCSAASSRETFGRQDGTVGDPAITGRLPGRCTGSRGEDLASQTNRARERWFWLVPEFLSQAPRTSSAVAKRPARQTANRSQFCRGKPAQRLVLRRFPTGVTDCGQPMAAAGSGCAATAQNCWGPCSDSSSAPDAAEEIDTAS